MIEHLVIAPNPESPKRNIMEKLLDFDLFYIFLRDPFPKRSLFPMKTIIIAGSNPTKYLHDECGPPPSSHSLNAIPNFSCGIEMAQVWHRLVMH
jgi:hypothetical protein